MAHGPMMGADVGAALLCGARGAVVGLAVGVAEGRTALEGHLFRRYCRAVIRDDIFLRN